MALIVFALEAVSYCSFNFWIPSWVCQTASSVIPLVTSSIVGNLRLLSLFQAFESHISFSSLNSSPMFFGSAKGCDIKNLVLLDGLSILLFFGFLAIYLCLFVWLVLY